MNNGKICVSVCAETADEMIAKIRQAEEFADVIEVRFDCLRANQIAITRKLLNNSTIPLPLVATFRPAEQHGRNASTIAERKTFWQKIPEWFWAVDVEEDAFSFVGCGHTKIASFHDFDHGSDSLEVVFERLAATGADVIKIAVQADDTVDSIPVWRLFAYAKGDAKKIIPIAMGEAGNWTRILGLAHGAFLTYASLDDGDETAPGQFTAKDLLETYRVKELDLNTKVYGVVGDPVSESLSPYMHNAAFAVQDLNSVFIPLKVKNLDEFLRRMVRPETREVELNFKGFAVTMPHKQKIIEHLDAIDPTAEKIGAVNTVKIEGGKLIGFNTDACGFITPLKERFGDLKNANVAVFGAGGAARACVYALRQEGADVTVFARDMQKANALAHEFGAAVKILPISLPKSYEVIVNATPLGMKGLLENEALLTADELKGVNFIYDLVTGKTDTPLVREARIAGAAVICGTEMLLNQAAKQFEIWTGQSAPLKIMREAIFKRIGRKQ